MNLIELKDDLGAADTFRFFEEKLGAGIWRYDVAARRMQWSHGFYQLLGLTPGAVVPSSDEIRRRIHPDDRELTRDLDDVLTGGLPIGRDLRIVRPDGRLRWVCSEAELLLGAHGEPAFVLGVALDVTKREASQLQRTLERYNALTQAVEGQLWIAGSDGRIKALMNPNAAPESGPKLDVGHSLVDLLPEEDRDAALKTWSELAATGRPYEVKHRFRQSDGTYRWFRCSVAPVTTANGLVREWIGISIDVHDKMPPRPSASRLTGAQMRAARGLLKWSVRDLARHSGISPAIIRRLEEYDGTPPLSDNSLSELLRSTLSGAGIEFLFPEFGKPGLRPR
jgi:PAS domain S-box-containing protein